MVLKLFSFFIFAFYLVVCQAVPIVGIFVHRFLLRLLDRIVSSLSPKAKEKTCHCNRSAKQEIKFNIIFFHSFCISVNSLVHHHQMQNEKNKRLKVDDGFSVVRLIAMRMPKEKRKFILFDRKWSHGQWCYVQWERSWLRAKWLWWTNCRGRMREKGEKQNKKKWEEVKSNYSFKIYNILRNLSVSLADSICFSHTHSCFVSFLIMIFI